MKSLFKHLKAIAPFSQNKTFQKRCFSSIFCTVLTTLPSTTLFFLLPSQKTLAQSVTCQSPYNEVYAVTQPSGTADFYAIYAPTGAAVKFTSAPSSFGVTAINTAATDHVNKIVYYGDANKIYAWDAINNQHITVTADFQSLLTAAGYAGRFVSLSSGGAAFYDGALYVGVDGTTTQDFEIFRVNLSTDRKTAVSVTPLGIKAKSGGVFTNSTQDDWGDFIISDAGVILALSNNRQAGQRRFWRFDLNTNTYVAASTTSENLQLAKSGDGRLWGLRSNNTVVEVSPSGSVISSPVSTTVNAFDGAECVVGEASVGDRVWSDTNGDGIQDAGETGIAGVTVAIYRDIDKDGVIDAGEPKLATQVTDVNGNYNFTSLLPHDRGTGAGKNDFIVRVESGVPAAYTATTPIQKNADLSSATQTLDTLDFGYKPPTYNISGTLYEDTDGDNNLGGTEAKLPANITVNLLDSSNNVVKTTTTDVNGAYTLTGVTNGSYKIQVDTTDTDIPSSYTLGTPNDLAVTVSGSAIANQNFGFDEPATGNICISPSIATLPSTFNSSNYTKNTALQGLVPLSFYDGTMQVNASLSGTATWTNGVQVQTGNLGSFTGDYLYLQPANASNYLASNNEATYVLSFPSGIPNFSMIGGGLNNNDGTTIIASYKGVPIQITAANFSQLSSGMTLKDADSDGQSDTVVSSNTSGGANVDTNTYKLTIPVPVDKITVVSGKDESGNNGTVTIGLHTFQYCYEGGAVSGTLYEDSDRGDDLDASEPKLPKDITVTLYKDNNNNNTIDTGEEVANTLTNAQGQYTFTNVAAGTYKVKVDTTDTDIPSSYTLGTPNDLAVTVSGSAIANQNFGFDKSTNPNVLLIKRITKINDDTTTNSGDDLSIYNQDNTNPYDDNKLDNPPPNPIDTDKWIDTTSDTSSTFLIGGINGGKVKPNDELEYTIYFLSAGDTEAKSVLFCDRVPSNVTFIPNSFNNQTQATAGSQNSDRGILWLKDGNTESLTNVKDGDAAQYFPPGVEPSTIYPNIKCDGTNTNGAVVVNLQNLPNATAPGTPNGSYGFVRFRGKVK
ncbi:MAG: Cna B-type domain-containing protein [Richelia sp. RM2_1_2]|nr:Cna B-type domain-containing protein [Richelia sp. RM2_1_2]